MIEHTPEPAPSVDDFHDLVEAIEPKDEEARSSTSVYLSEIGLTPLLDADSEVSRAKASPLNYDLLEEYNTRPRTSYLAQVRNPHPDLRRDGEETS